jgi:hypothetical protein
MTLAVWHKHITDEEGDIVEDATITVRREVSGAPLADLYSDRDGLVPKSNPFTITSADDGFAEFFAAGGAYRVQVVSGILTRTWRYEAVGTSAETDAGVIDDSLARFMFDADTADSDPGIGFFRANNATFASVTQFYVDDNNVGEIDISSWLNTFDDFASTTNRGVLEILDPAFPTTKFAMFRVTGTVVDGTGYKKLTVTPLVASAAAMANIFTDDNESSYILRFSYAGQPGTLTAVMGDLTPTLGGDLNANGHDINMPSGSELNLNNGERPLSTGIHTIWIPATSMVPRTTNGPALVTTELATNDVMLRTLDFDQTTHEGAQFQLALPKSWDLGSFTFIPYWTAASGAGGVVWGLGIVSRDDDDPLDAAFGVEVSSSDTFILANDLHIGPESGAVTPDGTPAIDDLTIFQVRRVVSDGNDTLTADAKLIGIKLLYNVDAPNDA